MGTQTQPKIPVINMEDLKPGTNSWVLACHKVRQTLEEYGCFMAVYEGVSLKESVDAMKTLFDLPIETKLKNTCEKPDYGYIGSSGIRPRYENMGIQEATDLDNVEKFANLMWPSGNENFSKVMHSYANLVSKLEKIVRNMVFESYGVEKYNESYDESMSYLLKFSKYAAPKGDDESNLAASAHTDKTFISILGQNDVNGLQVQVKDGEWVTVDFLPSSFIVIVGDAFMAWSNGRLRSPPHRVVIPGLEDRYSILLFAYKKGIIEIPEELIDDEHPPKFKPFDHFNFFENRSRDRDCLDERAIKLYCGI